MIIAASYGGKWDIINAVKKFYSDKKNKELTENSLEEYLETRRFPNPDLIIRSGGEQRLSNFYLWQSSYSELYFSENSGQILIQKILISLSWTFLAERES